MLGERLTNEKTMWKLVETDPAWVSGADEKQSHNPQRQFQQTRYLKFNSPELLRLCCCDEYCGTVESFLSNHK
jgi:hypothetical protein